MSADLYTAPQHVGLTHVAQVAPEATLAAPGGRSMQDRASELRRIPLLGTSVNKEQHFAVHPRFMDVRYTAINRALGGGGRWAGR